MKKINVFFLPLLLITTLVNSQNTATLLVNVLEQLPNERSVITQSVTTQNLAALNSEQLDYSPVFYKNGILFTSNRKAERRNFWAKVFNKKSTNLFYAEKIKDGKYELPTPLQEDFEGKMNEGAVTIDASGKYMIYAAGNKKGNNASAATLDLYYSELKDGKWSKGVALPINSKNAITCHPSLSADSKTLYFASNREGGYGGMDIYKSVFVDGKWDIPLNMGKNINSAKNEVFPFINHDGTLYYSSNGKGGDDHLDIYFSRIGDDGKWKEAINMGAPFNSPADDFGFYIENNGLSGLFSSDRTGGKGKDDLYFWRMDQSLQQALDHSPVKFTIMDKNTGDNVSAAYISLIEFNDKEFASSEEEGPIAFASIANEALTELLGHTHTYQTDANGNFSHDLKHDRNYMLVVEKEDYTTFRKITTYNLLSGVKDIHIALTTPEVYEPEPQQKTLIDLAATEELDESMLNPLVVQTSGEAPATVLKEGQKITLDNIYYEFNKAELKAASEAVLNETVAMLQNFPEMEINLISHSDARGKASYNKILSQKRAEAAKDYLIAQGIAAERVNAIGLGEEELLNECADGVDCSKELHSQNRRTEIVITKLNPANEIFVKKE